jgi:hypothetical protein
LPPEFPGKIPRKNPGKSPEKSPGKIQGKSPETIVTILPAGQTEASAPETLNQRK